MIRALAAFDAVDTQFIGRAKGLQQALRNNYLAADKARRLPDENIEMLRSADLLRILVPRRLGGHGRSMTTALAIAAELARGCPSTAWVQTLLNVTTWAMASLPPDGQREVFLGGESPLTCGVLAPSATARPVDGGYVVDGKWAYASGCYHAHWATGGVAVLDDAGNVARIASVCMRMSDLSIEDTWFVAGMRATGSNTLIAKGVFVPDRRVLRIRANPEDAADVLGEAEASDRWPVGAVLALVLCGPIVGMAETVLESVAASAPKKALAYTRYPNVADSQVGLRNIGQAATEIEAARLHLFHAAATIDATGDGLRIDKVERARIRAACGHAMELLRGAVDRLISTAGSSSFAEAGLLQRYWRDLNVASRHAFLGTEQSFEQLGRSMLGAEDLFVIV